MSSFEKKIWKNTVAEYPTRRVLHNVSTGADEIVTVTRSIGTVTQEGDVFNAATMNDLEGRIATGFEDLGDCTFSVQSDGAYVTYTPTDGADPVKKKLGNSRLTLNQIPTSKAPSYEGIAMTNISNGIVLDVSDFTSLSIGYMTGNVWGIQGISAGGSAVTIASGYMQGHVPATYNITNYKTIKIVCYSSNVSATTVPFTTVTLS